MGTISRQAGAPIADGETSSGTEMEAELVTIHTVINGNVDNANVKTAANIAGTKLADNTIPSAKMLTDTLTVAKMSAAAVPKFHLAVSTTSGNWDETGSLVDFANLTAATLTPGSTNDMIFMDVTVTVNPSSSGSDRALVVGWSVNSSETDDVTAHYIAHPGFAQSWTSTFMVVAPAATSMTIKPMNKGPSDSGTMVLDNVVFRCWILPGKA